MSPIYRFFAALLMALAWPAQAQESTPVPTLTRPELASSIGQMLAGLAAVIVLLLATLWVIKRMSTPRGNSHGLKVLAATAVGPRERVVLVEVADTVLVLGVAQGWVCTLHSLPTATLPTQDGENSADSAKITGHSLSDFATRLRQHMERKQP